MAWLGLTRSGNAGMENRKDKMRNNENTVAIELRKIAKKNGGILQAENVVESARLESSPIHLQFNWDNSEAAHLYRLQQARQLIRCTVIYEPRTETHIRAFVSLSPDRETDGGGYRETIRVLGNKAMRAQMLADALKDLDTFEQKYKTLSELAEVFNAARKIKERTK